MCLKNEMYEAHQPITKKHAVIIAYSCLIPFAEFKGIMQI